MHMLRIPLHLSNQLVRNFCHMAPTVSQACSQSNISHQRAGILSSLKFRPFYVDIELFHVKIMELGSHPQSGISWFMASKNLMSDYEIADWLNRNFLLWREIDEELSYVSGRMDDKIDITICHPECFAIALICRLQPIRIIIWKGEYLSKKPDAWLQEVSEGGRLFLLPCVLID